MRMDFGMQPTLYFSSLGSNSAIIFLSLEAFDCLVRRHSFCSDPDKAFKRLPGITALDTLPRHRHALLPAVNPTRYLDKYGGVQQDVIPDGIDTGGIDGYGGREMGGRSSVLEDCLECLRVEPRGSTANR